MFLPYPCVNLPYPYPLPTPRTTQEANAILAELVTERIHTANAGLRVALDKSRASGGTGAAAAEEGAGGGVGTGGGGGGGGGGDDDAEGAQAALKRALASYSDIADDRELVLACAMAGRDFGQIQSALLVAEGVEEGVVEVSH